MSLGVMGYENISALIFLAGERSIGVSWLPRGSAIRFERIQQSTVLLKNSRWVRRYSLRIRELDSQGDSKVIPIPPRVPRSEKVWVMGFWVIRGSGLLGIPSRGLLTRFPACNRVVSNAINFDGAMSSVSRARIRSLYHMTGFKPTERPCGIERLTLHDPTRCWDHIDPVP